MTEYTFGKHAYTLEAFRKAFEDSHVFNKVTLQYPSNETSIPSSLNLPEVYIARGRDDKEPETNGTYNTDMTIYVIIFCEKQPHEELEITKAKLEEEAENIIFSIMKDADFRTNVDGLIKIEESDGGPLALESLGYVGATFPPYGSIRIDTETNFEYEVPVR